MQSTAPLLIQIALRAGKDLTTLCKDFHININRSSRYPNLVHLKYDQFESNMNEALVRQCRGLILDEATNWTVIARPFDKFFNIDEPKAATIDWTTAKVAEKLDGSLTILYRYDDGWHVATSGTCDGSGQVGDFGTTFKDLFWRVFLDKGYKIPSHNWNDYTFMFELMTPFNQVVVKHQKEDLLLIGIRHNLSGVEWPVKNATQYDPVPTFKLQSLADIKASFNEMNPAEQEGYVVYDQHYNRVKVKHPGYVILHHIKSSFNIKYLVELVRSSEIDEVLAYFPEWKQSIDHIKTRYDLLVSGIEIAYIKIKHLKNQKDFASDAIKYPFSGILFALRKGEITTINQGLRQMRIQYLVDMLALDKDVINKQIA